MKKLHQVGIAFILALLLGLSLLTTATWAHPALHQEALCPPGWHLVDPYDPSSHCVRDY